ncbi:hypothetical protein AB6A40_003091 [Gnathostoma spinigerum]|uniref:Ornithine decarboxylase antizyme n=1 Tax=Gnathostoma spinigerum TaxID=75299 RepID=A0ABD6EI72_9BILA
MTLSHTTLFMLLWLSVYNHQALFQVDTVVVVIPASGAVPDVPNTQIGSSRLGELGRLVKGVSPDWCWHIAETQTLALFLPLNRSVSQLSKEAFVSLLEYCEDQLPVKRVLICFSKRQINLQIASCFKYIGFNPLHPDHYPSSIDPKTMFAMVYNT